MTGGNMGRQRISVRGFKLLFMAAALISFGLSVSLWFTDNKEQGMFVGLWVPSILALGVLLLPREGGR
jgi:hypothetical protein